MKSNSLNGIVLVSAGAFFALLGFVGLASLGEGNGLCWLVVSSCWNPTEVSVSAFYFAVAGSALLTIGVWESRVGRKRIVVEGAGSVLATGSAMLALGFYVASLPTVSFIAGEIAYFCGLLGGSMLLGALAKVESGQARELTRYPSSSTPSS